jgi:hypothetical protein
MAEIINLQNINPNTFEIQTYSLEDNALISSTSADSTFNPSTDIVEYFIYDLNGSILSENVSGYPSYYINNNIITLTPEENLKNAGFTEGNYNTLYNFLRPKLGSNSLNRYFISEISSDRTEIRLDTTVIPNSVVVSSTNELSNEISTTVGSYYDFYLDFGNNQLIIANNVLLDNSNPDNPTVLIKLYEALPQQFTLKNELWAVIKVLEPVAYNISITNTFDILDNNIYLKGPNTNLNIKDQINNSTDYINSANLNATNTSQGSGSFQYQLNSLLVETGIEINIDYSDYSNFIHFSSAQTRLENFYYKLSLIEQYNYSASLSSGTSTNYYVSSSNVIYQNKIDNIITNFDGYEYFLYYESGSTCWPKTGNTPPYTNVTTTSLIGQNWLISQSLVAENYDLENNNALTLAIPSYISEDPDNLQFELFVEMIGQSFDSVFVYLQDVTNKYNADNRLNYGVSKELVADILRDMGIKIYQNNFSSDDLYTALIGFTPSGSLYNLPYTTTQLPVPANTFLEYIDTYVTASATGSLIPTEDINFETYKRIYANLPLLLKKKGSTQGLRNLITTFGIPDTILRVNEFGGQDKNTNTADFWQNTYNYSLLSNATSSNAVYIPFQNLDTNFGGEFPRSIELRFKPGLLPSSSIKYSQSIISETGNTFTLVLEYTGSGYVTASYSGGPVDPYYQYATLKFGFQSNTASIYLPFYNGEWWSALITADTTTNTTYTLYAGSKTEGYNGGIAYEASSSFVNAFFWNTLSNTQLKLNHSGTFGGKNYTAFTGSYQEFRYYNTPLSKSTFDAYVLNPNSIEGNTLNSSKNTLAFRLALGGELYTGSTSIHPAITGSSITQSFVNFSTASFSGTTRFIPNTEIFYYEQAPVGIQNVVSNKLQTQNIILPYSGSNDSNIPNNLVLSPYISIQQSNPLSSSYSRNVDYVEIGFSPQNEINEDINSSLGFFNIGEYIGDPRQVSSSADSYPDLNTLRDSYFSKYFQNYQEWDYVRLIQFFDNSLFKMVADFVPARTSLAAGIIIKQHLLERNKYPVPQADISSSIANVASGSTNIPFIQQNILFTGSIPMETITGSDGGTLPNLNGQTSSIILPGNYNTTVTQVWGGSNSGPLGVVPFTDSYQYEFFDGAFSGSNIVVTTQSLNPDNILLDNQAFYPTIADYQNLNTNTAGTITLNTGTGTLPFSILNRFISYYNTSIYQYSPNYNIVSNISVTVSCSFNFANPGDNFNIYLVEETNGNTSNLDSLTSVIVDGILNLYVPDVTIKSGSIYYINYDVYQGGLGLPTVNINSATNWTITTVNPQVIGYPNDPNIYQQSTFPGNLELYPDYNAILNNVYSNRLSDQYFDVDYSQQGILPVNQGVILSQSAVYAQVQDSNYTLARSINPRYVGSKNISAKYNVYTVGDSSYGKKAAIDTYVDYFVYFDWIGRSNPEYPGGGNIHLTYLIDIEGKATPLTGDNTNLFTVSNIFVQGQTATILPAVYSAGKSNPIVNIVEGGALIDTVIAISGSLGGNFEAIFTSSAVFPNSDSLSYNETIFHSGSSTDPLDSKSLYDVFNDGWLYPFVSPYIIKSGSISGSVKYYEYSSGGSSLIIINKSTLQPFSPSSDNIFSIIADINDTYLPIQKYDYIRFGQSTNTLLDSSFTGQALYQITQINTASNASNFNYLAVNITSGSLPTPSDYSQNWRIMRRVPKDNYVLIKYMPPYDDSGFLIPQNFNPNYDPYTLARKAGLVQ